MKRNYRAAIIGLGRIATMIDDEVEGSNHLLPMSHMGSYLAVDNVEFVGGADPYTEQREAFANKHGVNCLYEDYKTMLEREKPDIVSVCTSARSVVPIMDCRYKQYSARLSHLRRDWRCRACR